MSFYQGICTRVCETGLWKASLEIHKLSINYMWDSDHKVSSIIMLVGSAGGAAIINLGVLYGMFLSVIQATVQAFLEEGVYKHPYLCALATTAIVGCGFIYKENAKNNYKINETLLDNIAPIALAGVVFGGGAGAIDYFSR